MRNAQIRVAKGMSLERSGSVDQTLVWRGSPRMYGLISGEAIEMGTRVEGSIIKECMED